MTMEARIAALVDDFTPSVDEFEGVAVRHLTEHFGCDAAYFATIGPTFVDRSPFYFQRILADPQHFDPGQRKAREIVGRLGGPSFVDTDVYTAAEQDRLPVFRELLRPAGISSVILSTVNIGERTTGMIHLVRSARPFRQVALDEAKPLLRTIAIMHQAVVGAPIENGTIEAAEVVGRLSPRELQVGRLAADGYGALQIAAHLGTSVNTVRRQLESTYKKCQIGNRVELAMLIARTSRVFGDGSTASTNLVRILGSVRMHPAVRA